MSEHTSAFGRSPWGRAAGGVVLGVALAAINQGDVLLAGHAPPDVLIRAALTVLGIVIITAAGRL